MPTKKNNKIVFIDDDVIQNTINKKLLEVCGFQNEIVTFTNPENALDFIKNNAEDICVIFLDINMPVFDGWKILEFLNDWIEIPVYMLTSSINTLDLEKVKHYSIVKKFISKPLDKVFVDELKLQFESSENC